MMAGVKHWLLTLGIILLSLGIFVAVLIAMGTLGDGRLMPDGMETTLGQFLINIWNLSMGRATAILVLLAIALGTLLFWFNCLEEIFKAIKETKEERERRDT